MEKKWVRSHITSFKRKSFHNVIGISIHSNQIQWNKLFTGNHGCALIWRNKHRYGIRMKIHYLSLFYIELHFYYVREFASNQEKKNEFYRHRPTEREREVSYSTILVSFTRCANIQHTYEINPSRAIAKQMYSIWISFKVKWVFAKSFSTSFPLHRDSIRCSFSFVLKSLETFHLRFCRCCSHYAHLFWFKSHCIGFVSHAIN